MIRRSVAAAVVVLGSLFALESSALAFCRTTTVQKPASWSEVDLQQCFTDGKPLFWAGRCVGFSLNSSGSSHFPFDQIETTAKASFSAWSAVSCSSGAPSLQVSYLGPSTCGKVEFRGDAGNVNVVVFRDASWPDDLDPQHVIALTTVQYNTTTGELRGFDMEINTAKQNITIDGTGGSIALPGVLTHEAGHVLGFAHSTDKLATMYERYSSTIGTLTTDDIGAMCTVYPPDGTRPTGDGTKTALACDPTPPRGYVPDCTADTKSGCSCAIVGAREERGGRSVAAPIVSVGLLFAFLRRRRRTP